MKWTIISDEDVYIDFHQILHEQTCHFRHIGDLPNNNASTNGDKLGVSICTVTGWDAVCSVECVLTQANSPLAYIHVIYG